MALEGSLDVFNLPEILQMVSVQKKTGILTVQGESDIVAVSFLNGQVVAADALNQTVEEGLGQVLAQMELVQPEDFAAVAAEHQAGGGRMVDLLQQRGYVERPQLLRALRTQTFGLLRQLLEWKRGDFKFYGGDEVSYEEGFEPIAVDEVLARATPGAATPGAAAPRAAAPATPAAPDGAVVVELPSEVSVYSRISPPPQRVRLLDESPGANLREGSGIWVSREEKLVLDRLDGKRSIAEIGRDLRIGAHRALRALERLAELGLASSADRGAAPAVAAPPAPRPAAKAAPPPAKVVPPSPFDEPSIPLAPAIVSMSIPARSACFSWNTRSGVGVRSAARIASRDVSGRRSSAGVWPTTHPSRSISSPRSPFWKASLNVRPIAITSPTDFICVVSRGSAVGNFSKANRGIFTTT